MCTAQWWMHALVLKMVFSILIWMFVNIFRVVFIQGLVRMCWQCLNTGNFTFLATATADGVATFKEEDLADRIQEMLIRLRLSGFLLIVLACVAQVPWIFALQHFSSSLINGALAR